MHSLIDNYIQLSSVIRFNQINNQLTQTHTPLTQNYWDSHVLSWFSSMMCSGVRLLQFSLRSCSAPTTGEEGKRSRIHVFYMFSCWDLYLPNWARGSRCHKQRNINKCCNMSRISAQTLLLSNFQPQYCSSAHDRSIHTDQFQFFFK